MTCKSVFVCTYRYSGILGQLASTLCKPLDTSANSLLASVRDSVSLRCTCSIVCQADRIKVPEAPRPSVVPIAVARAVRRHHGAA